uniref:Major facilitator superfamily (MFS) profile domain-containing protein n=1 Tax=Oryza barthii TaxID=65489 RepID=A0A0D3FWJ1_9ORYZ
MAGGGFPVAGGAPPGDYAGGITFSVVVTCLMAASGGLIFGYDIGISGTYVRRPLHLHALQKNDINLFTQSGLADDRWSGGVTAMESFLAAFFPGVLRRMAAARRDEYCPRADGVHVVMLAGGALFFAGAAVNAAAVNIAMLIVGRMLLGFGIGFTNQAAPVYLAETAPAKWRGAFTTGFQLFLGIGNLTANLTNYGAARIPRILWRQHRPHLVMAVAVPLLQQLTGVIVIAFFSPVLFQTAGFGSNASLMGAVILGAVNLGSTLVSIATVDRYGRRVLFLTGGLVMIACQVAVAWIMGSQIGRDGESAMARRYSVAVLALTCVFSAAFGWSWGPLTWVIPGEIFPVEIRSAGQGISVAVNLGATFVLTQTFLAMLCSFKYATFLYYAAWVAVMTAFVWAFLPETKGVPLEAMGAVWARHWYWRRFVQPPPAAKDAMLPEVLVN